MGKNANKRKQPKDSIATAKPARVQASHNPWGQAKMPSATAQDLVSNAPEDHGSSLMESARAAVSGRAGRIAIAMIGFAVIAVFIASALNR